MKIKCLDNKGTKKMVFHNGRLKPNMTPMIVVLNYMTSQLDK